MNVAQRLRKDNIVDYLLYMWQVEDLIRACKLDKDLVERNLLSKYDLPDEELQEVHRRYMEFTDMMLEEGLRKSGHLSVHRIILMELEDLHKRLLADPKEYIYNSLYLQVLPSIIGLRERGDKSSSNQSTTKPSEIETALEALYGYTVLRLKRVEVSQDTTQALSRIAGLFTLLSERYKTRDFPEFEENLKSS